MTLKVINFDLEVDNSITIRDLYTMIVNDLDTVTTRLGSRP